MSRSWLRCVWLCVPLMSACGGLQEGTAQTAQNVAGASSKQSCVINNQDIAIAASRAKAVIAFDPFRMEFLDQSGQSVLRQSTQAQLPINPSLVLTEALGSDSIPDLTSYSPLSFEVGGGRALQFPAGPWTGNQLMGASVGVQYSATKVMAAKCTASGIQLTLATSDPTGRTIQLEIMPEVSGIAAFRVAARLSSANGVSAFSDSFVSDSDEEFFGFGGRHNSLSQRGSTFPNWVEQENFTAGPLAPYVSQLPGTGGDTYMFPNGPTAAYYPQALFVSSRPYGFLLENQELSRFRLAYRGAPAWQVSVASSQLRYTVVVGDRKQSIGALTAINGRHRLPPAWAMGTTLSRAVRTLSANADNPTTYSAKIDDDLAQMAKYGIKPAAYAFEGWETLSRDRVRAVIAELKKRGIHPVLYIRSFVGVDVAGTEPNSVFQDALTNGYLATVAGTSLPYLHGSPFVVGVAGTIDFTKAGAREWWRNRIREMFDLGADGFMQDFGETVMWDMSFASGANGADLHNQYPTLYHRTTMEVLDEYSAQHPDRELFFFTRAGYSGRPGSAAYEFSNFPGDETTDWSRSSGLASIIPDMLNRGVGGAYGFNTDIGGYEDIHTPATTAELFTRWAQAAALTPFFRVHNSASNGVAMPWSFDRQTLDRWKASANLHERVIPLMRKLWLEALDTGVPITRPLWLEFPNDPKAVAQDQEFMLGNQVLVAPIVQSGATSRTVYFPAGCWEQADNHKVFQGPGSFDVQAGLDVLPYFTVCGSNPF